MAESGFILQPPGRKRTPRPSEIHERFKELAFEAAQLLGALLAKTESTAEQLKIIELVVKHSLGQKIEYAFTPMEMFEVVGEVAAKHMEPNVYRTFRAELEERLRDL